MQEGNSDNTCCDKMKRHKTLWIIGSLLSILGLILIIIICSINGYHTLEEKLESIENQLELNKNISAIEELSSEVTTLMQETMRITWSLDENNKANEDNQQYQTHYLNSYKNYAKENAINLVNLTILLVANITSYKENTKVFLCELHERIFALPFVTNHNINKDKDFDQEQIKKLDVCKTLNEDDKLIKSQLFENLYSKYFISKNPYSTQILGIPASSKDNDEEQRKNTTTSTKIIPSDGAPPQPGT